MERDRRSISQSYKFSNSVLPPARNLPLRIERTTISVYERIAFLYKFALHF